MKKSKNKKLNKYFTYALLCVVSFALTYILAIFISKQPDIMEWHPEGRALYIIYNVLFIVVYKNRTKF